MSNRAKVPSTREIVDISGGVLNGIRIADMPDLGALNDGASVVGEYAGSGRFSAVQLKAYSQLILATGSSVPRYAADRWARIANVFDFGAVGNGSHDDTAAIQAAVATGNRVYIPRGTYRVTTGINITTQGQIIEGDGKGETVILVATEFNMSSPGVFVTPGGPWVPGPQFRDFQVNFVQPDTTAWGSIINYPTCFMLQAVARATLHRVKINAAMHGIDLTQNAAGASVVDCELCCFDWHIHLDGEADSITVNDTRFEPDLLTPNQMALYHTHATGILTGRCDDLHVNGCLFFCMRGIDMQLSSDGVNNTFGNVTNTDFDTYNGINIVSGNLQVSGCGFTLGDPSVSAVVMSGGNLSLSACWMLATVQLTNEMILASPPSGCTLQMSACRFDAIAGSTGVLLGAQFANVTFAGCQFTLAQVSRTNAAVQTSGSALLTMNGCRFSAIGGGSGNALNVGNDATHNICGNAFGGWATVVAGGPLHIMANNNP